MRPVHSFALFCCGTVMSRGQTAHLIRLYIQLVSVCRPEPTTDGNGKHLGNHGCAAHYLPCRYVSLPVWGREAIRWIYWPFRWVVHYWSILIHFVDLDFITRHVSDGRFVGSPWLQFSPQLIHGVKQDDLSDGSSLELMAGDFPLTYHGDQIGLYWTNLCIVEPAKRKTSGGSHPSHTFNKDCLHPSPKNQRLESQLFAAVLSLRFPLFNPIKCWDCWLRTNSLSGLRQRRKLRVIVRHRNGAS